MAFGQIFYIEFEKVRTRIGAASHIYEIESLSVKPQFRSSQHDQSKSKKNSKMKNEENTERWKRWIDGDGTNGDDICKHLLAKCFWCKCVNAGMCVFLACLLACACVRACVIVRANWIHRMKTYLVKWIGYALCVFVCVSQRCVWLKLFAK